MDLSVVIPVYNSREMLADLLDRLRGVLEGLNQSYEVILVDDGSTDDSFCYLQKHKDNYPQLKIIRLAGNFGQQNAVLCGLRFAGGQRVVTLDDDLQHPPEEIPLLLQSLDEGFDLVFGVPRDKKQHPPYRNLGTLLTDKVLTLFYGKPACLRVSSFRAAGKTVVERAVLGRRGFVYISVLLLQQAKKPVSIPVRHEPRARGKSHYHLCKLLLLLAGLVLGSFTRTENQSGGSTSLHSRQGQHQQHPREPRMPYVIAEIIS